MAEIEIIASVIAVAGCGFRLSLLLNAVGCEIASAGLEIHSISKGVTLFSLMLKQIGQTLEAPDSVHSSEALETVQEITSECQMVFDEIQDMVDKVTSKKTDGSLAPSVQQRFKWCFRKARVQYLLAQLESLKMSLLVMLQILQLGRLMASTPRHQPEHRTESIQKSDAIAQERAEAQNLVIIRYWQINRLDRLFAAAEDEEATDPEGIEQVADGATDHAQLAIEAPPEYCHKSVALIRLPIVSLGELDSTLNQIKGSPRDMLRVSDAVIDPLLNRWTRWQELRDRQEARPRDRYAPSVHNLYESDVEQPTQNGHEHEEEVSPRGFYLEGTTTDWRKPNSAADRQRAAQLRKKYSSFQPSVSVDSSEEEVAQGSQQSRRAAPAKYIIDSSSDTSDSGSDSDSDSESRHLRYRRDGNAQTRNDARSRQALPLPPASHSYSNSHESRASFGGRNSSPPNSTPQSTPRSSTSMPRSPGMHRQMTLPAQTQHHPYPHASPLPPLHTSNAPNPYPPHSPYSPHANASLHPHSLAPPYPGHNAGQVYPPRYMPAHGYRMPSHGQLPVSSYDGRAPRSPSRLSRRGSHSHRSIDDFKKSEKSRKHKNMKRSATKGILGASALAGFLEALEGLEL